MNCEITMPLLSNTTTNRYGSIAAEIYDIDKPVGVMPDTAFHVPRLAGLCGAILEPACGSGRALLPLLEAGCDATGFDPSPEMLNRCRARCDAGGFSPGLSRMRFEDFHYDRLFSAVFVPVGSFGLVDDFDVALAVLRRFADHLEPGGLLVLDVQPVSFLKAVGDDRRRWIAANGDLLTVDGRRLDTDWITQREERHLRYERWRDNRLMETQLEPVRAGVQAGCGEMFMVGDVDLFCVVTAPSRPNT